MTAGFPDDDIGYYASQEDLRCRKLSAQVARAFDRFLIRMEVLSEEVSSFKDRSLEARELDDEHIPEPSNDSFMSSHKAFNGELVNWEHDSFKWSFHEIQSELKDVLTGLLESDHKGVERTLRFTQQSWDELALHYGSLTAAVDGLVRMRQSLPSTERENTSVDSWVVSAINEVERFLREVVGLCTLQLGRYSLQPMVMACLSREDLKVPQVSLSALLQRSNTDRVLADVVTRFMAEGSRETADFCEAFGAALGVPFYADKNAGFKPGVIDEFAGLFPKNLDLDAQSAWNFLLDLRHEILHRTALAVRPKESHDFRSSLHRLRPAELRGVLDFLTAFGCSFGIRVLRAVFDTVDQRALAPLMRTKWSTECRAIVSRQLNADRFGLAWVVCSAGLEMEPAGSDGTMLQLSRFLAQKSLKSKSFVRRKVIDLPTHDNPRYELYKRALLGDVGREACVPLLNEVVTTGNMSMTELSTWRAYRPLRETAWWSEWYGDTNGEPWVGS